MRKGEEEGQEGRVGARRMRVERSRRESEYQEGAGGAGDRRGSWREAGSKQTVITG